MPRPVPKKWLRNPSDALALREGCTFDAAKGQHACNFIENFCRQSKGRWAGQPIKLLDWEGDFLMRLYGWRRADGRRRYKRFYVEIAKKNGKTTLLSAMHLLELIDGDDGPECYNNACDRDQASMLYDESARMVKASPDLSQRLDVIDSRKVILYPAKNGRMRANSSESGSKDGLNPSFTTFDELHRQPNRELWEVFEYAGVARLESLMGSITTAGEDEDGIWFEQREYAEKVNDGTIEDTTFLGIVYRALPTDDIDDPATWRKANPSLGVTIDEDDFRHELAEAKQVPVKLNNFKRLRLNIVARAAAKFFNLDAWQRCAAKRILTLADFRDGETFLGLDLADRNDLAAMAILTRKGRRFRLRVRFWCPEDNLLSLEHQTHMPYRHWAEKGYLTPTPGGVIDYGFIRREIKEAADELHVVKLLADPYAATKLLIELRDQDGIPVGEIRQGFLSLSEPTKEFRAIIDAGDIEHDDNPVMNWCVSNAVGTEDEAKNVKLSKKKSRQKIDGAAAAVNAVAAATDPGQQPKRSVYNDREMILL
jgi:phage terminase large subunit-like protein